MRDDPVVAGNTTRARPADRPFYPALDGLRAAAFLLVFLQHYHQLPWGWTGVDLFFVLSGFLITGILWDTRDDPHRVGNFYIRRTLRIFPLYYGIMLVLLLAQPFMHWLWNWHWLVWPAYVGNFARFVRPYSADPALARLADFVVRTGKVGHHASLNLGHFWSLCVEEQFYLVWPWMVFFVRSRRALLWICGASVPACLLMRLIGQSVLPQWMLDGEVLYRMTPFRLDALLIGGWVALWMRGPHKRALFRLVQWLSPVALAAVVAWVLLSPYGWGWHKHYVYPPWKFTWGLTAVDVIYAGLLVLAMQPQTMTYRIFKFSWFRWLGRISYGAYVFHDILHTYYFHLCERFEHPARYAGPLALLCTIILAALSYYFFEAPFLNVKERWTRRV